MNKLTKRLNNYNMPTVTADVAEVLRRLASPVRCFGAVFVVPASIRTVGDVQSVTRLVRNPVDIVTVVRLTELPSIERRVHFNVINITISNYGSVLSVNTRSLTSITQMQENIPCLQLAPSLISIVHFQINQFICLQINKSKKNKYNAKDS